MTESTDINLDECFVIQDDADLGYGRREHWPDGIWKTEPDVVEWMEDGYYCLIRRNNFGCLCGYVGVDPLHAWYRDDYAGDDLQVHGGITFTGMLTSYTTKEEFWSFGFDCGHAFDFCPGLLFMDKLVGMDPPEHYPMYEPANYRPIQYVVGQIRSLITQAHEHAHDGTNNLWT